MYSKKLFIHMPSMLNLTLPCVLLALNYHLVCIEEMLSKQDAVKYITVYLIANKFSLNETR